MIGGDVGLFWVKGLDRRGDGVWLDWNGGGGRLGG